MRTPFLKRFIRHIFKAQLYPILGRIRKGDGRNSPPNGWRRDPEAALNGLTILNDVPTLDRYYRDNVIGGASAFVLAAPDYRAFAAAILAKLIREIAETPVARPRRGPTTLR